MLLTVQNLSKSYGAITILQDVSFVVNAGQHIGLVGPNGVGKSTLLRLLMRQEEPDEGSITYGPSVEVGYLPQTTPDFYGQSIDDLIYESLGSLRRLEERMHALEAEMTVADEQRLAELLEEYSQVTTRFQDQGGYELDHKISTILDGLRLSYLPRDRDVSTLSGGERARVGLATLLLRAPDIVLFDEPTNHLDVTSLEWLESYLAAYHGAALIVSHDRQFLNRAVNAIFELDEYKRTIKTYVGNYDAYVEQKAADRQKWQEDYEQQQEEIKELRKRIKEKGKHIGHSYRPRRDNDKFAVHFFSQRVDKAVSRDIHEAEERLKRIEENPVPKPPELVRVTSYFKSKPMESQEVIRFEGVGKQFDGRLLFRDLTASIGPRARITLVGPNGIGKTTLFKLILGLERPDMGSISVAPGARIGYLPQEPDSLDLKKTVLESYREGQVGFEGELIGKLIGYGLFRLEDMQKQIGQLSIGQRRKLEIARLMATDPNVLLLDEPTNFISLDVLEAFEEAIVSFPGPVLVISHDRWFLQRFGGETWTIAEQRVSRQEAVSVLE